LKIGRYIRIASGVERLYAWRNIFRQALGFIERFFPSSMLCFLTRKLKAIGQRLEYLLLRCRKVITLKVRNCIGKRIRIPSKLLSWYFHTDFTAAGAIFNGSNVAKLYNFRRFPLLPRQERGN
jgi:hypothetical protein